MKKSILPSVIVFDLFVVLLLFCASSSYLHAEDSPPKKSILDVFFRKSGEWKGEFQNYVNRNGGVIQEGTILVEIKTEEDQIIRMRNNFFDKNGKESGYTGYTSMKIVEDKLEYVGNTATDENTGNRIENHTFKGYCLDRHIYIFEEYTEIFPDGRKEKRRNSLHYILSGENEIIQVADVYTGDQLLVFAHSILKRTSGAT